MVDVGKHVLCEQVGFGDVGVAAQDERSHTNRLIGPKLGEHLVGVANAAHRSIAENRPVSLNEILSGTAGTTP